MKYILRIFILSLFFSKVYGQNIFKISENSDLTVLATIDSTFTKNKLHYARIKNLNSNKTQFIKFTQTVGTTGREVCRHKIRQKDTIILFANIQNDTLIKNLAINENPKLIYNSIQVFKEKKKIKNNRKRLNKLKEWFVTTSINNGIKPYLSRIMRNDKERGYFFNLIDLPENQFVFNSSEKKILTKNISQSRCLRFEDFYIVYLMRYSYDSEFEENLKNIMKTYCLPFGDAQLHMMKTIMFNKQSEELEEIYARYKKKYYGNLNEAKKVYNEFTDKI